MVQRCVEFFNSHGEFEKSIELLVKVGKVNCLVYCVLSSGPYSKCVQYMYVLLEKLNVLFH